MKKILKTLSLVLLVVVLSGCVKQHVHMDISGNEVTVKLTDAMDSSIRTEEDLPELKTQYEELGFKVSDYNDSEDGYIGVVASKTFKLDDVSSSEAVKFHLENLGSEKIENPKIFQKTGDTYKATLVFDTLGADSGDYSAEELESYASSFDLAYSVTLPSKAISHNADVVEGNTYTWNITYGEVAEINYEFKASGSSMFMYIIIGVAVLVIVVIVLLVLKNRKGKGTPAEPVNTMVPQTQPVSSVTPEAPTIPMAPVEPVAPTVPMAPVEPVAPATPVAPMEAPVVEPNNNTNQNMQ